MGFIRSLISLALLAAFVFVGATVPIGHRTLFGHVGNIWQSDEAQELVDSVKESSGPLVDRVKRGVKAGLEEEPAELTANKDANPSDGTPVYPNSDATDPHPMDRGGE